MVQLEQGTLKYLSITRVAAVLETLGLSLIVSPAHERPSLMKTTVSSLLDQAARMASVSCKGVLDSKVLKSALTSGILPIEFTAHMLALLDEVSVSLLARAVEQLHREFGLSRQALWSNMCHVALDLKTTRGLWRAQA